MASGWSTTSEDHQFIIYKMDSLPSKKSTSSPVQRRDRHVGFKEDVEEVRENAREASAVHPRDGGFQAHQQNVDKEADEFIKYEHKKFQWSRTMPSYTA